VSVPTSSLFKTVTVRCGHCSSLLTVNMRGLLFPGTPANTAAAAAAAPPPPPAAAVTSTTATMTTAPPPPPATSVNNNGQFHFIPHSLDLALPIPPHQSLLLDEISSAANPSLQLLEQHGLGGMITSGRNAAAPHPHPPQPQAPAAGKGAKEPSPRANSAINRPPEKRQRVPSAYNRFIKDEIQRIKAGNPDISHREAFSAAAKNWAHFPHIHFGLMPDHQGPKKTSLLPQDNIGLLRTLGSTSTAVGPGQYMYMYMPLKPNLLKYRTLETLFSKACALKLLAATLEGSDLETLTKFNTA
ncbi:hypothetical protein ACJX0J_009058, partial [Zea mays]